MHTNSKLLFQKYAKQYFSSNMNILEIGPDRFPSTYSSLVDDNSINWDTLDLYKDARLTYSTDLEYIFPILDNKYDLILSAQVIEHVRKPWIWIKELARVLKTGGTCITINPASWPYHEAPIDCWRVYPDGMKALYEDAGLDVLLSVCESLESENFQRNLPGRSVDSLRQRYQIAYHLLGKIGFPVECSYDTITIGVKH